MWLTTQMHREEELAAMQYPAGNWSSSCNKIAGTCGTSQWPFECLAEGERCFCFAFPRESIATSIILHGGIDEGTAEEGDKGAVSSSFYLGGSYQIHGGGVIASLGNHCTEFDEVSFDIGLQFKPDGLYVKMYNGMVFIMAKPLY
ncbi:uncharacterized protein [Dermacentor albipictus]|uniref:uncharacterized protein isoform X6 n=1 Tax=Dermacentor albipictus TaxID=60249 RepID=UPI0038FCF4BD